MKLTAAQYQEIADIIRRMSDKFGYRTSVAKDMAEGFGRLSMRFNKKKFLEACNANMEETE